MIRCDGCLEVNATRFVTADGHEARYCEACETVYRQFVAACLVAEEKHNRLLDHEVAEIRTRVPLLMVPQDLPRRPRALEGLTLG